MLYKGYIKTKGKKAIEAFKDRTKYRTYDEVKNLEGFGGVLADDTILIDIDDAEQSEILMNIVEEYQLDCRVYCTSRGRHFLFKNHSITRNRTHVPLAVGLTADIKLGTRSSYEVIKIDGEERFIEWDIEEGGTYQEVPKWLFPVRTAVDFLDMDAGDGRNQALFNYILTLTSNDFSVDDTRECIRILNRFVLKEPLSDDELEVILRDVGCDVARFGDDKTVITPRIAGKVFPFTKYSKKSTMETAGNVILTCKEYMQKYPKLKRCIIKIDDTGVGGGVTDRLKEVVAEERLPYVVVPVNNGSAATDDYYANLGSQIWGELRDALEENFSCMMQEEESKPVIELPYDDEMIKQLSNRRKKITSKGKIQLESKDDMKKRGVGSPDIADSITLAFYEPKTWLY